MRCVCLEAGASIIHHHTDDPLLVGRHATEPYRDALDGHPRRGPRRDPLSDDGRRRGPHDDRANATPTSRSSPISVSLRLALVDPGSVSLGPLDADGLPMAIDLVYQNTLRRRSLHVRCLCVARGLAAHVSIFEPGFLRDRARVSCPPGACRPRRSSSTSAGDALPFGLPPTAASLEAYLGDARGNGAPVDGRRDRRRRRARRWRRSPSSAAVTCASGSRTTSATDSRETPSSCGRSSPWPSGPAGASPRAARRRRSCACRRRSRAEHAIRLDSQDRAARGLELRDVPDPHAGSGEVRIRVAASGVNFADVMARMGLYPTRRSFPASSATRCRARSTRSAPASAGSPSATRVLAPTRFKGYAELVVVPAAYGVSSPGRHGLRGGRRDPGQLSRRRSSCWRCSATCASGDRVLIHGAGGGVGLAAVQLCRIYGAEIIGTASTSKHAALRAAGVAHTIDYRTQDFVAETKRATGGKGADVIHRLDRRREPAAELSRPRRRSDAWSPSACRRWRPGPRAASSRALWQLARMPRFGFVRLMNDEPRRARLQPRPSLGRDRPPARLPASRSSTTPAPATSVRRSPRRSRSRKPPPPTRSSRARTSGRSC